MSNEAVRIKKRNDIASRISTYLVLALVAIPVSYTHLTLPTNSRV
mgnify:CR=1 FL=1